MEIMLYQEPSQDSAAGAALLGQLTGGPHRRRRAQDHLWVAAAARREAEGTIKEHLGFQQFPPRGPQMLSEGTV